MSSEYMVVADSDFAVFLATVQRYLDEGWGLCGGVAMRTGHGDDNSWGVFAQALIRQRPQLKDIAPTGDS